MSRLHLIEIHEQPWCPAPLREGLRDGLFTAWKLFFWTNALPHLRDLLSHAEEPRIVDLCSGSGGPIPLVTDALAEDHPALSITLTDLFPAKGWNNPLGEDPRIGYAPEPVDATAVPAGMGGCPLPCCLPFLFLLTFDGFVSILRTYTTEELAELARKAGCKDYRWEVRQSRDLGRGLITCLIGWPDEEGGVHVLDYPP